MIFIGNGKNYDGCEYDKYGFPLMRDGDSTHLYICKHVPTEFSFINMCSLFQKYETCRLCQLIFAM